MLVCFGRFWRWPLVLDCRSLLRCFLVLLPPPPLPPYDLSYDLPGGRVV